MYTKVRKTVEVALFVPTILLLIQCGTSRHTSTTEFIINDAYYQSYMAGETEKGTTLTVKLSKVGEGISFDSLIFRGLKVHADVSSVADTMVVKGYFRSDMSLLPPLQEVTDKPDCIIYRNSGIYKIHKLQNIRRLNMKIN